MNEKELLEKILEQLIVLNNNVLKLGATNNKANNMEPPVGNNSEIGKEIDEMRKSIMEQVKQSVSSVGASGMAGTGAPGASGISGMMGMGAGITPPSVPDISKLIEEKKTEAMSRIKKDESIKNNK